MGDSRAAIGAAESSLSAGHGLPAYAPGPNAAALSDFPAPEIKVRSRVSRRALVWRSLLFADIAGLAVAYFVATRVAAGPSMLDSSRSILAFVLTLPLWVLGAKLHGLYDMDDQRPEHSTVDDLPRIFQLVTLGTWLGVLAAWAFAADVNATEAFTFWVVAGLAVSGTRSFARVAVKRHPAFPQNTIIVGAGEVGQLVGRKLLQHSEFGVRVIGFVDSEPRAMRGDLGHLPLLGEPKDVIEIVRQNDVDRVVVAFSNDRHDLLVELVRSLRELNVQIDLVPRLFEAVGPAVSLHTIEGVTLVGLPAVRPSRLSLAIKRLGDILFGVIVLTVTAPLLAFIAWRIKRDSPGPVLFRQERLGGGQRPFTLLKFRTMSVSADDEPHREYLRGIMDSSALPGTNNLYKLERPNDVTRIGAWLRRTSLDELPQLINVLRGDMSLVGPRPCIPYEIELYEPQHFDRFLVPAGMTGLWQVAARAHSTFKEALDLDAAYARNWSLRLDIRLLARTPQILLRRKGTM